MYVTPGLEVCDDGLARVGIRVVSKVGGHARQLPSAPRQFRRFSPLLVTPGHFNRHLSLSDFDDDGLGKFKLKKIVKSVAKPVSKAVKVVGKVAAAPTAVALQAVGAKSLSAKLGKAVDYTKGEMNVVKSAGKGVQVAAVAAAAVYAAPYAAAAAKAAASKALVAGKFLGGKAMAGGKLLAKSSLLKKAAGLFVKSKGGGEESGPVIDTTAVPESPFAPPDQATGTSPSYDMSAIPEPHAPPSPFAPPSGGGGDDTMTPPDSSEGAEAPKPPAQNKAGLVLALLPVAALLLGKK